MRIKIPVVYAAGITLSWVALASLFFNSSSGNSAQIAGQSPPDGLNAGPDVIVGNQSALQQFGSSGTEVGLAMGTDTCNSGNQELDFFAMPNTDHPVLTQNLYRMSGGSANNDRFEQIGQSWVGHGFFALQNNACAFGCVPSSSGTHLGPGCSTADSAGINAGPANLGSRAWVNPFTGIFPSTANSHTGHTHTGTSHRILVNGSDLDTTLNPGATYYAEAQLITPHEYSWCQAHPGECNTSNNASYRQFNVAGTKNFVFSPIGSTVRMTPAINAWPGATIRTIEPAPGVDGRAFLAYKVTGPVAGFYHYEYAIYNQNLDRGIQSFAVPVPTPNPFSALPSMANVGFHAPPQHPGFANDGTQGDTGFSNAPWTFQGNNQEVVWSCETIAQNANANAIRWGTLYNFSFDAGEPWSTNATIEFFKTGAPITVAIEGPRPTGGPPTPPPSTPSPTPSMPAHHFAVVGPQFAIENHPFPFTVTALDQFNNTVTNYAGTIHFTSNEHLAVDLPTDSGLTNGTGTFTATFHVPWIPQTITATDTVFPSITGTSNPVSVLFDDPPVPTATPTPSPTASPACTPLPPATEGFDNITSLTPAGWFMQNNSQPGPGKTGWFQGDTAVFVSQSGTASSYIGANLNNGSGKSTLSNWLLTPQITFGDGSGIIFWTRTVDKPAYPDRLQVRLSTNGASTNVGTSATDVGDFTTLLLDINPTYSTTGYPSVWTEYIVLVTGVPTPVTGRLAFRYFVENGGPGGTNSDYVGIDSISIGPGCGGAVPTPPPTPTPTATPAPGEPTEFRVIAPTSVTMSTVFQFTVQATEFGMPTEKYDGTVHFTSSDPAAVLPPDSQLSSGFGTFSAELQTLGTQFITATDIERPTLQGTSNGILVQSETPTPTPTPTAPTQPLNVSTRLYVQTGDHAGIGGFIVTGTAPKPVIIRGIGPSLSAIGVSNALANPTLDLRTSNGIQILTNDNWRDTQETEINATGIPPTNDLEAAIVATLNPGGYTAILHGAGATSGAGLVEIYDLDQGASSKLANLSTRAFVGTGNDVVIAGFILGGGGQDRIVLRGIGPSLTALGVPDALPDPTLELRDSNGALLMSNNDWRDDPTGTQPSLIVAAGLGLTNNLESGIAVTLTPGMYTAVLAGRNGGTGVGLVEIYDLGLPAP